jgi:hypothetical protein
MFSFLKRSRKPSPVSRKANTRRNKPSFEALETREVLSITVPGFTLDNSGNLYNTSSAQEQLIDTGVKSFAVANSNVYDLHANYAVYHYSGSGNSWATIGGGFSQIASDGQGSIYGLGTDYAVYHYSGSGNSWATIGGGFSQIDYWKVCLDKQPQLRHPRQHLAKRATDGPGSTRVTS